MDDRQKKFVERIRKFPDPNLEGAIAAFRKLGKKAGIPIGKHVRFSEATEISNAKRSIGAHEARIAKASGKKFPSGKDVRGIYDSDWPTVKKLLRKASEAMVAEYSKKLPKGHPMKNVSVDGHRFYLALHLGRSPDRPPMTEMYEYHWDYSRTQPFGLNIDQVRLAFTFGKDLISEEKKALALYENGYCNVVYSKNAVVFIKNYVKELHADEVRGTIMLSREDGPAVVYQDWYSKSNPRLLPEYWFRGVEFRGEGKYGPQGWEPGPSPLIDLMKGGKLSCTPKQALKFGNTEQRRVLMEMFSPEEILAGCDAKLIDGPTDSGNELFSVDVGLGDVWHYDEATKSHLTAKLRANMLRYECPSTGRKYAKFVPWGYDKKTGVPSLDRRTLAGQELGGVELITKADQAQAWSHHYTLDEYLAIKAQS